jgi:hypothetical protein
MLSTYELRTCDKRPQHLQFKLERETATIGIPASVCHGKKTRDGMLELAV